MTQTVPSPEPKIGLRERNRRERFARILNAAEELFIEKGFDQVTTREIAQAAGVGEATLFRYVANKGDLLLLVIGRTQDALIDRLEAADDETASATPAAPTGDWFIQRILDIYQGRIRYYETDPENIAKFVSTGLEMGSTLGPRSTNAGDRVVARIREIIEAGQAAGALRDGLSAETIARNVNGIYIHEVLRSPARNLDISLTWDRLAERFDVMLRPLTTSDS